MAMFHLTMQCDNEAFSDDWPSEVGDILQILADKIRSSSETIVDGMLRDHNGNTVGKWSYEA